MDPNPALLLDGKKHRKNPDAEIPTARIFEMARYLARSRRGAAVQELAREFSVSRYTIYRDLARLEQLLPVQQTAEGRYYVNLQDCLETVAFTLHEAMALYLAARLLATRMDRRNRHAASAMSKLGTAFQKTAPQIGRLMAEAAGAVGSDGQIQDLTYLACLEKLTQAMAEGRRVTFGYRKEEGSPEKEYAGLAPYFLEPYAVGRTTYVVGPLGEGPRLYTFKVERITRVELLGEGYAIPPDFNVTAYLGDAWGIWTANPEQKARRVVLRFSKRVAARVQETRWHRLQQTELLGDGLLLWQAEVAEPREMLPWILGWGSEVEVLEPQDLREQIYAEALKMLEQHRP